MMMRHNKENTNKGVMNSWQRIQGNLALIKPRKDDATIQINKQKHWLTYRFRYAGGLIKNNKVQEKEL